MNLIDDCWLPALRADGVRELIAPWQIAETENPVTEIIAPRPDFQGALYQFLIGLLQTTFAPEDIEEWLERWHKIPETEHLKDTFEKFSSAFELTNSDGPAFMQDFDLPASDKKSLAALLIESPGEKTCKDNQDLFVKGGAVNALCQSCAAAALFTLQINAPSGGAGHRVGLRGGGPLTTLVLPNGADSLWHKLWANVLVEEALAEKLAKPDSSVLPWLAPTRCSVKGETTFPDDVHILQQYWSMPRRIRLNSDTQDSGHCSICGIESLQLFNSYRTKNYGTNYDGPWLHSLTPYRFDPKKKNLPLSLKGQDGGLGYRHWLGLIWQDVENGDQAAANVRQFNQGIADLLEQPMARLWCFGFDMDNMKARCWYEHTMPILHIAERNQETFFGGATQLIESSRQAASLLRGHIKAAWFKRPKDVKGDMNTVIYQFWQNTEADFYRQLSRLAQLPNGARQIPSDVAQEWHSRLKNVALSLFDQWVLNANTEDMKMKEVVQARNKLQGLLYGAKPFKALLQIAQQKKEISK